MTVKTLHEPELLEHCHALEDMVSRNFTPDVVVGIATGGARIAEYMFKGIPHITVTCRRPVSESKRRSGGSKGFARLLPVWVKNVVRILDKKVFYIFKPSRLVPGVNMTPEDFKGKKNILVVDDAIEGGTTMLGVLTALRYLSGDPEIRSAVITTTSPNPLVLADYTLYNNRTLIRFPWDRF